MTELMVDFIDPEELAKQEIPKPAKPVKAEDKKKAAQEKEEEDQGPTGPDPDEVTARFEEMGKIFKRYINGHDKHGSEHKTVQKARADLAYIFLRIKYPAKMVDHLVDRPALRRFPDP